MNIGIVTTWFERGAAYVSKAYADLLSERHNIFIYARGGESYAREDEKWSRYNVTWGHRYSRLGTRIRWGEFKRWVKENSLDVIFFNEQNDWEVVVNCRTLDVPIVSYIDYYKPDTVELFDLYDAVFCNTRRHQEVFQAHPRCIYLPWGTDVELFRPRERQGEVITFFHSAGMGGVNLRKGTDKVVRCFSRLTEPARLVIHSQVPLERYHAVAELIRNDRRIEFLNQQVGAPGLYHLGDVYLYPSKLEGIGLTIAEALSCGLPVITTDTQPMNEFVTGEVGRLVAVQRYVARQDAYFWPESECCEESLYAAMREMCQEFAKDGLKRMKSRAREHAVRHLDWRKNAAQLCAAMEGVRSDPAKAHTLEKHRYKALVTSYAERKGWVDDAVYYARRLARKCQGLD